MMALDNSTESWVTAQGVGGTGWQQAELLQSQGLEIIPGLSTTPVLMGTKNCSWSAAEEKCCPKNAPQSKLADKHCVFYRHSCL